MKRGRTQGRLFFVVGPSGAGKDTLIAGAIAADPGLIWARRCITRSEATGGEPFEGLTEAEFDARLQAGKFALHWQAHGLCYGVPHAAFAPLENGQDVLLNGSRGAIAQAQAVFPNMRVINITAPDHILAQRLAARGREGASDVAQRLARASFALPKGVCAIEVINDGAPGIGAARLLQAIKG
jgi:ribose 1,5-bisphosphokinase